MFKVSRRLLCMGDKVDLSGFKPCDCIPFPNVIRDLSSNVWVPNIFSSMWSSKEVKCMYSVCLDLSIRRFKAVFFMTILDLLFREMKVADSICSLCLDLILASDLFLWVIGVLRRVFWFLGFSNLFLFFVLFSSRSFKYWVFDSWYFVIIFFLTTLSFFSIISRILAISGLNFEFFFIGPRCFLASFIISFLLLPWVFTTSLYVLSILPRFAVVLLSTRWTFDLWSSLNPGVGTLLLLLPFQFTFTESSLCFKLFLVVLGSLFWKLSNLSRISAFPIFVGTNTDSLLFCVLLPGPLLTLESSFKFFKSICKLSGSRSDSLESIFDWLSPDEDILSNSSNLPESISLFYRHTYSTSFNWWINYQVWARNKIIINCWPMFVRFRVIYFKLMIGIVFIIISLKIIFLNLWVLLLV